MKSAIEKRRVLANGADGEPGASQVPDATSELARPIITVTPRTESSPRGIIVEDPVRGTEFWEIADCSDRENDEDTDEDDSSGESPSKGNGTRSRRREQQRGTQFALEWRSWCSLDLRII